MGGSWSRVGSKASGIGLVEEISRVGQGPTKDLVGYHGNWEFKDNGKVLDSFEQGYLCLIPILFCRFLWRVHFMAASEGHRHWMAREGLLPR